ncbi:MAG: hypothetical protein ACREQ4_11810 [Candidatus Binataceae bacterium]
MRNCLILGSGRSGTSLAAGVLAKAGYFMGKELYPPDDGNPKGYFEDHEINGINEGLLARLFPAPKRSFADRLRGRRPKRQWDRWLAEIQPGTLIRSTAKLDGRIAAMTVRAPFCFKDPRFCYTLPAWRPYLANTLLLCVFRHPAITAASLLKEAQRMRSLNEIAGTMDLELALRVWRLMYTHVVETHYPAGEWLFVHYDQLADGSALARIEWRLGARVDREFADTALRRSRPAGPVPPETLELYQRLCGLAGFRAA